MRASICLITTGQFPDPWDARGTAVRIGAVERSRAAKRVRRSEVILRPLAAETFIQRLNGSRANRNVLCLEIGIVYIPVTMMIEVVTKCTGLVKLAVVEECLSFTTQPASPQPRSCLLETLE